MRLERVWSVVVVVAAIAAPRVADAQSTILQIRPHSGDTLRMRLDQESEMTGVRKLVNGESSAMVLTSMRMFSKAIVEGASNQGTTVLAVTDSVLLSTTDERAQMAAERAAAELRGERVQFRVSPDGIVTMLQSGDQTPREIAQVVALMPAAFPTTKIRVGESWIRDMSLPAGMQLGAQVSGKLHMTFRLDSLTHHGTLAYVSMRGEMQPATGPGASEAGFEKGFVNGTMLVDQKRGWLTESWFNIVVSSTVTPPASTGILSTRMQMRITQHMHTDNRP